ncbi:unannotated protein [freshwater metagenome]|uniref:Unannotated protein n=1 Tax=freshwater metagenome TaxID=449393 RepID=A0A6J7R7K0_9ZZZZ
MPANRVPEVSGASVPKPHQVLTQPLAPEILKKELLTPPASATSNRSDRTPPAVTDKGTDTALITGTVVSARPPTTWKSTWVEVVRLPKESWASSQRVYVPLAAEAGTGQFAA